MPEEGTGRSVMECKGIQEKLCAYLEGVVSPEESRIIGEHLHSCQKCGKNLADLKKAGELVKDLAEVEPPAWLTQKIMSRVRAEDERKKGIWQKLFYPLHIKVPIQALATVFIAVIAVFVFRAVEPEMKLAHLPSPTKPVITQEEAANRPREIPTDSPAPRKKPALKDEAKIESARVSAVPPGREGKGIEKEGKPALPGPAEESLTAKKKEAYAERLEEDTKAAGTLRKQELAELKQAPRPGPQERESLALSGAAKDTRDGKKLAAAPGFKEVAALKLSPTNVLVKVPDVHVAGNKVDDLFRQLGAKKIDRESREGKTVLTAELKAMQVKEFFEKLKVIGEVSDKDIPLDIPAGDVIIRIEIVPTP
jgi:hypothetical protein